MRYQIFREKFNFYISLDNNSGLRTPHKSSLLASLYYEKMLDNIIDLNNYILICESETPITLEYMKEHYPEEFV